MAKTLKKNRIYQVNYTDPDNNNFKGAVLVDGFDPMDYSIKCTVVETNNERIFLNRKIYFKNTEVFGKDVTKDFPEYFI
jgi:hypothetical protein